MLTFEKDSEKDEGIKATLARAKNTAHKKI